MYAMHTITGGDLPQQAGSPVVLEQPREGDGK